MIPQQFVAKWSQIQQKETAVSHSHFNDICQLVGHKPPIAHDPTGRDFSFEAQSRKVTRRSATRAEVQELDDIHAALDTAVLDAYGWPHDVTDEEILERLLALNLSRAE